MKRKVANLSESVVLILSPVTFTAPEPPLILQNTPFTHLTKKCCWLRREGRRFGILFFQTDSLTFKIFLYAKPI